MPTTVNLQLIGVWFCVGFFAGAGWAVAAWLVGERWAGFSERKHLEEGCW